MDPATASAIAQCLRGYAAEERPDRATEKTAVKGVLHALTVKAPGRSVEVRVAPYAAVQIIAGPTHRRGTPPACVQLSAQTLLRLATGEITWDAAVKDGRIRASGARSDLSALFPIALD